MQWNTLNYALHKYAYVIYYVHACMLVYIEYMILYMHTIKSIYIIYS